MFSALIITSARQGAVYDEQASARAFGVIERLADFAGALLRTVRHTGRARRASLRAVRA